MLQPRPDLVWTKVPLDIATFGLGFEIQITLDWTPSVQNFLILITLFFTNPVKMDVKMASSRLDHLLAIFGGAQGV